jgi:DNA-binding beta-propeller fold protein YncE
MKKILFFFSLISILAGCAAREGTIDYATAFYPPLPQKPRLQFLTQISGEEDISKKQSVFGALLTKKRPQSKYIQKPYDIAAIKNKIYIMDRGDNELLIIDLENGSIDSLKSQAAQFQEPAGIWVTDDGYKYVTDYGRKSVLVFDNRNKLVRTYGKEGELARPLDVAVFEDSVFVSDFDLQKIVVFDKNTGRAVRSIGGRENDEAQIFRPTHIALDEKGNLFVTDAFNFRVEQFDASGNFVRIIGSAGDFARPKGIAVDNEDRLYVVDTAFENVQVFNIHTGKVLFSFGGYGPEPGTMDMPGPVSINNKNIDYFRKYADKAFILKYLVYVGNSYGRKKINVYGFGEWTGEPSAVPE